MHDEIVEVRKSNREQEEIGEQRFDDDREAARLARMRERDGGSQQAQDEECEREIAKCECDRVSHFGHRYGGSLRSEPFSQILPYAIGRVTPTNERRRVVHSRARAEWRTCRSAGWRKSAVLTTFAEVRASLRRASSISPIRSRRRT